MLPPVDDAVLRDNPEFAAMYKQLTTVYLNPDGSTKDDAAAKERQRVQEELRKHRVEAAKEDLLIHAISTASPPEAQAVTRTSTGRGIARAPSMRSQQRPHEQQQQQQKSQASSQQDDATSESLADLLVLLPPLLSATTADDDDAADSLDQESLELLLSSPPLSELESLLPELAALTSASLHSSALSVARVLHPTTNPSYLHRHIPSLPTALKALQDARKAAHEALSAARLRASATLLDLLDAYSTALALLLRALEDKHGPVARSLDLRATEVSLRARRMDVDVRAAAAELHAGVYPSEAVAALANYAAHLRDARMRAEESIKVRTAELAEYGVGVEGGAQKERMMREMARVHRDMTRQLEDTKRDLERLEKN